jgi:hypothetical protein
MIKHSGAHKYLKKKLKKGAYVVWKCMLPGCPHYIKDELVENRMTRCWRCGTEFVLDKLVMKLTRPHCKACTRGSDKKEEVVIDAGIELLATLFGSKES